MPLNAKWRCGAANLRAFSGQTVAKKELFQTKTAVEKGGKGYILTRQITLKVAAEAREDLKETLGNNGDSVKVNFLRSQAKTVADGEDKDDLLSKKQSFFKEVDQNLKRSLAEEFLEQDDIQHLSSVIAHYPLGAWKKVQRQEWIGENKRHKRSR